MSTIFKQQLSGFCGLGNLDNLSFYHKSNEHSSSQTYSAICKSFLYLWFPKLPSYATFNYHLNRLVEAFRLLTDSLLKEFRTSDCIDDEYLIDSLSVITCSGKRLG